MYKFFLFYFLYLFCFENALALQKISMAKDETKNVVISSYEISRIFVKGDMITNVRGIEGAYILNKDTNLGQIYIKPNSAYQGKSFNLFLNTASKHSFTLVVGVKKIPGQNIEIWPDFPREKIILWEKNSPYIEIMIRLIKGIFNDEIPEGYVEVLSQKKTVKKYPHFHLEIKKIYRGANLYCEKLLVKNPYNYPLKINESYFFTPRVRALAFLNTNIPAKSETYLFRVVSET